MSINLTAGMRQNLFSLQKTDKLMNLTQTRLATGKRINSALDDPVNYFAALGHEQRAGDLAARKDEMSEAVQTVKVPAGLPAHAVQEIFGYRVCLLHIRSINWKTKQNLL